MSTFFISDMHFGHANVLAYDNRPFSNIAEHDNALIERWNSVVTNNDDVWILGDISWYGPQTTAQIYSQLNGTKRLCIGNHDKKLLKDSRIQDLFVEIVPYKEIAVGSIGVVLCHYPIPCFNHHYHGWVHLYGHVHNSFEANMCEHFKYEMETLYEKPCRMYNVGCMMPEISYTPRTLEQILRAHEGI